MIRHKAFKFRIYPTKEQELLIAKTFGCCRFVFNHFLNRWNAAYKEMGRGLTFKTCSSELTQLKKKVEWLREVDSTSLQYSLRQLDDSFQRFFKKQNNTPRFKSKKTPVQSYTTSYANNNIAIVGNKVKLPKLGLVRLAKSRDVNGRIVNATITKKPSGKYFVSILAKVEVTPLLKTGSSVGVDLGVKDFAILSDGIVYKNPKYVRRMEKKLAKEQKILSRRMRLGLDRKQPLKDCRNYQKQKQKVERIHEKITNCHADYLHKISSEIVKNHDIIGIEDFQVANMVKNRELSQTIRDVSWAELRRMLEYKAEWYGKKVIAVSKNFASSQL